MASRESDIIQANILNNKEKDEDEEEEEKRKKKRKPRHEHLPSCAVQLLPGLFLIYA